MADENKNIPEEEVEVVTAETEVSEETAAPKAKVEKKTKNAEKKPNFFVRAWKGFCKLCKDTSGELKKVVWTPKAEVGKSFKLVIATVVAVGVAIAVVDLASSWIINSIAGLIG